MHTNEVNVAFEILLEEIERVANSLKEAGAEAFKRGDFDRAREIIEMATRIADFHSQCQGLQQQWERLFASRIAFKSGGRKRKVALRRLGRGLRTPEAAFRVPILEALVELEGRATMGEVLDRVEVKMKGILNDYDYQPLPSNPKQPRWRNTAQWCRNSLVSEGLLKHDSPNGIWEISEAGRKWLSQQDRTP